MLALVAQFSLSGIVSGSTYALLALGLVLIHRTTGVLFFAQGALAMAGGVTLYALAGPGHLPIPVAVPMSVALAVALGVAAQWFVVLPLLDRGATPFSVSIATIGVALILETTAMVLFGKDPLSVQPFSGEAPFRLLGASVVPQEIWIVATAAVALLGFVFLFQRTWTGKAMTAVGSNPLLARAAGIPVRRVFSWSFVLAALIGAAAGVVATPISYTGYWLGTQLTIKGFVAAAIGGINSPAGAVLGALVIGFAESFGAGFVSSGSKDVITIVLLLLVLRWRPQGLLG
jgi:branched-chain amino acid transport system permease protein